MIVAALMAGTAAQAGGYAEPILAPEIVRPMPRPEKADCGRFLFWVTCAPANPSPRPGGEGGENAPKGAKEAAQQGGGDDAGQAGTAPEGAPDVEDGTGPVAQPPATVPDAGGPPDAPRPPVPPVEPPGEKPGKNPGNGKPVGKSPFDGQKGEEPQAERGNDPQGKRKD